MTKRPTLTDLNSLTNSSAINAINENWDAIQEAFDNTLSLDGSTPNALNADLDLDSNDIINVGTYYGQSLNVNEATIGGETLNAAALSSVAALAEAIESTENAAEAAQGHAALAMAAASSLSDVSNWSARPSEPIHSGLKFEQDGTWLSPDWIIMVAAGQSNSLGNANATTGGKTGEATGNVWAWDGSDIVEATLGAAPFRTDVGTPNNTAFHAAHKISAELNRPVLIILHSVAGSAIGTWLPPYSGNSNVAGTNWTGLNDEISDAMTAASVPCWGKSTVDLVLWQQGEAEYALSPLYTLSNNRYPALLSGMYSASWAEPNMQVIVGECLPQASGGTAYQVNEEWAKLAGGGAWPRLAVATGRDLTTTGSDVGQIVHYSGASLQEMGNRMADIFLRRAIGTAPQAQYEASDATGSMIWKGKLYARLIDMTFDPSNTYNQPVTVPTPHTDVPVVFELDGTRSEVVSTGSGSGNSVLTLTGSSPSRLVIWYPADAMRDEPPGISINKSAGEGTLRSFQIAPSANLASLFLAGHAGLMHSVNPANWPRSMTTFRINGSPLIRFDRFVAADLPTGMLTLTFTSTTPVPQVIRDAISAENTARGSTITTVSYGTSYGVAVAVPGPYADDTAAAAANVAVGDLYRKTGGTVAWRVS
ncbi:hypothetical protein EKK58_08220 [Candidatus Dependentiae bacterium]|nr:MAG: hypothetical protein EKK58_08220 [Candidatus Dependentiae bacterium]